MAWARKHGVQPPEFAIAKARAAGIDLAWLDESSDPDQESANCCLAARSTNTNCFEAKLTTALAKTEKHLCCTKRRDVTTPDDSTPASRGNHFIGWRALACRGQALHWLAAVPTLIMPPSEHFFDLPLIEYLAPPVSDVAGGICDAPVSPPPELA
jgi:hypothetical protein